jgi:hypothetical protein
VTYYVEFPSKKRPGTTVRERCASKQEAENTAADYRRAAGHDARVVSEA